MNPIEALPYADRPLPSSSMGNYENSDNFGTEVNHYLVSDELCNLPANNFATDYRPSKIRPDLPARYNMSLSNGFTSGDGGGSSGSSRCGAITCVM